MARLSYCADQVRRLDRDRFLCALFAPMGMREALFALYAFNAEVARVREAVNEPILGEMRMQWWRDALGQAYDGRPPRHHVVLALAEAVERFRLTRAHFERMIEARASDLDDQPPADRDALVRYAEATSATLTALSLEVLGLREGPAHEAGRHVGIAWALVGLLRAVPFHAGARRVYLPADLSREAGLEVSALFERRPVAGLSRVVGEIAGTARHHLDAARRNRTAVSRRAVPALLPATLAEEYLAELRKAGFDPFDDRVQAAAPGRLVRLALNAVRGRF